MSITYIAIVDDNRNLRNTLKEKLNQYNHYKVLFVAENGKDFLEAMREARLNIEPDVVLMDIDMPGLNGIEGLKLIRRSVPGVLVIMQTVFEDEDKIFEAVKSGAHGYFLKKTSPAKLIEGIRDVMEG